MIIEPLTAGQYLDDKAVYDRFTASALEYSFRSHDTVDAVADSIANDTALAVRIVNDDEVVAFGVLELVRTKGGKMLNIWTMAGEQMYEWLGDFLDNAETIAKREQCAGVMLGGRLGWSKALRSFGYGTDAVIMSKRVEQ